MKGNCSIDLRAANIGSNEVREILRDRSTAAECVAAASPFARKVGFVGSDAGFRGMLHLVAGFQQTPCGLTRYTCTDFDFVEITKPAPDIVVMDCSTELGEEIENIREIHVCWPRTPIIILGPSPMPDDLLLAIRVGASGYLARPVRPNAMCQALDAAVQGHKVLCQKATDAIWASLWVSKVTGRVTERQAEIMKCLLTDASEKEIALRLRISTSTLHAHLTKIYRRLGAHCRQEAVSRYLEEG